MRKLLLFTLLLLLTAAVHAQMHKLQGKVTNSKMEPLAYVSIQVKGFGSGILTKEDGTYELNVHEGTHELLVSMIGYKSQVMPITIKGDYVQNILLEEDSKELGEVVIRAKVKDRAEEVMRKLIQNKDNIVSAAGPYSSKSYIKAVMKDTRPDKKEAPTTSFGLPGNNEERELQKMDMAEIVLKVDRESDQRIKEERLAVKKMGDAHKLFYLSATEGTFNFYDNLIKVPAISPTPFLSPVSYSGLVAYKFKTLKIQRLGKHKIYTISVKPRQMTNATVEGELTVSDSAWAILHARFAFPPYHLQEYDFFEVEQNFEFVQDKAWMVTRQQFTYHLKGSKGKLEGQTVVTNSDFELNKKFGKRYFGVELSATAQEAYGKDSSFWQTVRKEPLTEKELRFIHYKDSLFRVTTTRHYLDSVDRAINRVTWQKVSFTGQSLYNREREEYWHLPSLLSLYQPVSFGGARVNLSVAYSRKFKSRRDVFINNNLSYGIRNNDINGSIWINGMYDPLHRGYYNFSAGREFQFIYEGDAIINKIKRSSVYQNNYIGGHHGRELVNGLFLHTEAAMAFRRSVSGFKTGALMDSLLGDVLENNQAVHFEPYNALYGKIRLDYTPKLRYIREPREKIYMGSKWPTFYIMWRKGIPNVFESKVDFDFLEYGLEQQLNLGLIGVTQYSVKTGSFLSKKDLRLIDYQFQRRGDPVMFLNPNKNFQALDSTFALFNRYYEGHLVHEFNGLFLNKVPLLKKLQLREVGGAGFLIAPERNLQYAELFVGVERAFKSPFNPLDRFKLGVYVVGSVANQFQNPVQLKIGFTSWDKKRNRWH